LERELDRIIEHLLRHKEFAILTISKSYPFNIKELQRYSTELNWECLSMNSNIAWTDSLFKEFEDMIDVQALGYSSSFPWSEEFIDKHIEDLFYEVTPEGEVEKTGFAYNRGLPWSDKFIEKYAEHWDWMWLSMNNSIPFTTELIDKFAERWDFRSLEFNKKIVQDETVKLYLNIFYNRDVREYFHKCEFCFKGEEIFEEYKGKPYNDQFCTCPNFKWTEDFASKLKQKIKSKEVKKYIARTISNEKFNHWSIDVLDAFEEFWNYYLIYCEDKLTDYLTFALKQNGRLDELMSKL
jgi:hypothetical protein